MKNIYKMALRSRGSFNVEIKLEGNWGKFNDIINSSNILMVMGVRQGQKEFAEAYRDAIKKNIITGGRRFGYPPNSPNYIYKKLRQGGSSSPLVWSKAFYNAVEVIKNRLGTRWMVGIPSGEKRPSYNSKDKNLLTIAEYANILEHGTNKIPPRPVFADTFSKDMGGKRGLRLAIEAALIRRFGQKGVNLRRI